MDSPGVLGDILFIIVPLRAGREDKHFLYHSDTHLLSVSASKAPRAAFCAVEMANGFSLSFPMKEHILHIFPRCYCGINKTILLSYIMYSTLCIPVHCVYLYLKM